VARGPGWALLGAVALAAIGAAVYTCLQLRTADPAAGSEIAAPPSLEERVRASLDDARARAASNDLVGARESYDQTLGLFDEQILTAGRIDSRELVKLHDAALAGFDAFIEKIETPAYEGSIPARDALASGERELMAWGKSAGVAMDWTGHELVIEGVRVEGRKIVGVASFGLLPEKPWRDLVVDLEFTIVSGGFQLYLRYWPDERSYVMRIDPSAGYELNKPYRATIRIKGRGVELSMPDQPVLHDLLGPTTSRTGGIGFGVPAGSSVILSSCKVKILWPREG
jgi:hypothetical protein